MQLKTSQKTYVPSDKDLEKKWYLVDVKGKTLGPTATKIADLLRGKGKPFFTPARDCGDFVIAINSRHIRLAGNKMETKQYQWHTRYPAGFRERTAREIMEKKPEKILYDAVWGMLPRNRLRSAVMKKLKICPETEHDHTAQKPETLSL